MELHEGMEVVARTPQVCQLRRVFVKTRELFERKCIPLVLFYLCNISKRRYIWEVQNSFAVRIHTLELG